MRDKDYPKNPFYIAYHGRSFTLLNAEYKTGWTFAKLKANNRDMYVYDKIFFSVDDKSFLRNRSQQGFWPMGHSPGSDTQLVTEDVYEIITWLFEIFNGE